MLPPHRVVIAAFPGVEVLDVTGPAEVFSVATRVAGTGRPGYVIRIATGGGDPVATSSGVRLMADLTLDEVNGHVDTLLVSGAVTVGEHAVEPVLDSEIIDWLREAAPRTHRVGSICAGAHLLAAAGLLDGLSATTHWLTAAQLAAHTRELPSIRTRSSSGPAACGPAPVSPRGWTWRWQWSPRTTAQISLWPLPG